MPGEHLTGSLQEAVPLGHEAQDNAGVWLVREHSGSIPRLGEGLTTSLLFPGTGL